MWVPGIYGYRVKSDSTAGVMSPASVCERRGIQNRSGTVASYIKLSDEETKTSSENLRLRNENTIENEREQHVEQNHLRRSCRIR